jgi:hypothetical protein
VAVTRLVYFARELFFLFDGVQEAVFAFARVMEYPRMNMLA